MSNASQDDGSLAAIARRAPSHVIVINPEAGALGRPLSVAGVADGAALWRSGRD